MAANCSGSISTLLLLESSETYWCRKVALDFGRSVAPEGQESWEELFNRLNESIFKNEYPLHAAADLGCERTIVQLLDVGADINQFMPFLRFRPIHLSAMRGHKRATEVLLQRGADPAGFYNNALDMAVSRKAFSIISLFPISLLSAETFFDLARTGETEAINALLENGLDINMKNGRGESCLHHALRFVDKKSCCTMVKWLTEKGADIHATDAEGITPLHIACGKGDAIVQEYLLDQGASFCVLDSHGNAPHHWSLWKGDPEIKWSIEKMEYRAMITPYLFSYGLKLLGYSIKIIMLKNKVENFVADWTPAFIKKQKRD